MFAASIQGEGVLAKSKCQSGLGTMQAWFPSGEPVLGRGSCVQTSLSTGLSEWEPGPRHAEWSPTQDSRPEYNHNHKSYFLIELYFVSETMPDTLHVISFISNSNLWGSHLAFSFLRWRNWGTESSVIWTRSQN